jgi:hypothetical protein
MGYTTLEVVITGYARMDEICRRGLGICGLNLGDSGISCLLKWSGERELSISLSAADWVRVGFVDTGLYQLVSGPALLPAFVSIPVPCIRVFHFRSFCVLLTYSSLSLLLVSFFSFIFACTLFQTF